MPLVSILTPTWNREPYLERVWKGLASQTYRNIEWLVADDGSSDGTGAAVHRLAAQSPFPVSLLRASVHIGKARMDNEAVARARGEFIVWNDSDDYLLPKAIETLVSAWNSIPPGERRRYVGVTGLCASEQRVLSTPLPSAGQFDTTWNDLAELQKVTGDMLNFTRTAALKEYPFPEVDLVIPEGAVWTALGDRSVRVIPEVLKIVEYRAPHCISFSGRMEYCRGRAHALAMSERRLRGYPRSLRTRAWKLITFIRCSLHGEISSRDQLRLWAGNSSILSWGLLWPVAWALAVKDFIQGKVRQTHREFLAARQVVVVTCEPLTVAQRAAPDWTNAGRTALHER